MNFQWEKLTSVCTDGAPAMTGCNVGTVSRKNTDEVLMHNSSGIAL